MPEQINKSCKCPYIANIICWVGDSWSEKVLEEPTDEPTSTIQCTSCIVLNRNI